MLRLREWITNVSRLVNLYIYIYNLFLCSSKWLKWRVKKNENGFGWRQQKPYWQFELHMLLLYLFSACFTYTLLLFLFPFLAFCSFFACEWFWKRRALLNSRNSQQNWMREKTNTVKRNCINTRKRWFLNLYIFYSSPDMRFS